MLLFLRGSPARTGLFVAAVYYLRLRAIALALRGPPTISKLVNCRRSWSAATVDANLLRQIFFSGSI